MKTNRKIFLIVITIFCLTTLGGYSIASDIKKPDTVTPEIKDKDIKKPPSIDRRPDLIVTRIAIVSQMVSEKAYRHEITIHVKNQGLSSTSDSVTPEGLSNNSRGSFKVRVEELHPSGVENFVCGLTFPALASGRENSQFCKSELIPRGELRRYRARVDYLNWINETKEDNNEKFQNIMVP
jgi:hypothetical protein